MILNVRCFIVLFATEYFQYNIHSEEELYLLKAECNNLDSITASDEPIPPMEIEISSLSNGDLNFYMRVHEAKENTINLYKRLLSHILPYLNVPLHKNKTTMLKHMENVTFRLE